VCVCNLLVCIGKVVGEFVVVVVLSDEICVREIVLTGYLEIFLSSSPSHWKLLQSICLRVDLFLFFLNVTDFLPFFKDLS
jgi:hypothetical protein